MTPKTDLSERDICTKFITPALAKAGRSLAVADGVAVGDPSSGGLFPFELPADPREDGARSLHVEGGQVALALEDHDEHGAPERASSGELEREAGA